jgi:hypothetical protein
MHNMNHEEHIGHEGFEGLIIPGCSPGVPQPLCG